MEQPEEAAVQNEGQNECDDNTERVQDVGVGLHETVTEGPKENNPPVMIDPDLIRAEEEIQELMCRLKDCGTCCAILLSEFKRCKETAHTVNGAVLMPKVPYPLQSALRDSIKAIKRSIRKREKIIGTLLMGKIE